ncbi:MAG TPA: hypothetical protein VFO05_15980 [Candidatus Limnocylindrales bacterium]|nr:hypothetical protein [Candidatus Limnocylindrales bacterium]
MSGRRDLAAGLAVIAVGILAVAGGTLLGSGDLGGGIESWPPVVRAILVGLSVAIGLLLLGRALTMLAEGRPDGAPATPEDRDVRTMIRAVRLAFLAVAALAAAGAWLVGEELLLVVAAVIAGVDVIETTFLLLVARTHRGDRRPDA